jgi:hypothetical protein
MLDVASTTTFFYEQFCLLVFCLNDAPFNHTIHFTLRRKDGLKQILLNFLNSQAILASTSLSISDLTCMIVISPSMTRTMAIFASALGLIAAE